MDVHLELSNEAAFKNWFNWLTPDVKLWRTVLHKFNSWIPYADWVPHVDTVFTLFQEFSTLWFSLKRKKHRIISIKFIGCIPYKGLEKFIMFFLFRLTYHLQCILSKLLLFHVVYLHPVLVQEWGIITFQVSLYKMSSIIVPQISQKTTFWKRKKLKNRSTA